MGEGAATLILESLDHAIKRKAPIYAEVAGYAATSEAFHMVVPKEDGSEMAMTMAMGLRDAGMKPSDVDYINAHATSTPIGDPVEVTAIRTVFKKRADQLVVNATKSLIGHTLGAAGALGGVACVMALRTGLVHPTVNYDDPDPACDLPGISAEIQERPMRAAAAQRLRLRQQQCGGGLQAAAAENGARLAPARTLTPKPESSTGMEGPHDF